MARARFEMGGLAVFAETREQAEGGEALAGGRDVVLLALDDLDRDIGDRADVDRRAFEREGVGRDLAVLEHALDGGEVELGRHVHDREVFVVEAVVLVEVARVALGHAHDLVGKGLGMGLAVHRHEGGELQEARIDHPAHARVLEADALQDEVFELSHRHAAAEVGDVGARGVGVDRAADQRQRPRLRLRRGGGEVRGGGERQRRGLADGDDVQVGAEMGHEVGEVERVVLDIELAFGDGDVAGVVPVGDPDIGVGQQALHGRAQERRVMAGHGGHEQDAARLVLAALHAEADQIAEGAAQFGLDQHDVIAPVVADHGVDAPVGFDDHAGEAALGDLTPGGHHLEGGMRDGAEHRLRSGGLGRGTEPLVHDARRFHHVVGHHVAHGRHSFPALCLDPRRALGSTTKLAASVAMLHLQSRADICT